MKKNTKVGGGTTTATRKSPREKSEVKQERIKIHTGNFLNWARLLSGATFSRK